MPRHVAQSRFAPGVYPGRQAVESQHSFSHWQLSVSGPPLRQHAATCSTMDTDYILHRILRRIASWAVYSFFTEVRVIGGEKVPMNGPIIVYVSLLT